MATMEPNHNHDCEKCKLLGMLWIGDDIVDVYRCRSRSSLGSLIIRFGSDGPEYWSMPIDVINGIRTTPDDGLYFKTAKLFVELSNPKEEVSCD